MAKRNSNNNKHTVIASDTQVKLKASVSDGIEDVTVELIYPVTYKYQKIDGDWLTWNGAGSKHTVSREDADILLAVTRRGECCGSRPKVKPIFVEV